MNKSKLPLSWLSHLILRPKTLNPKSPNLHHSRLLHSSSNLSQFNRFSPESTIYFTQKRHYRRPIKVDKNVITAEEEKRAIQEILAHTEKEEHVEREAKRKAGIDVKDDEEEEDYMARHTLIEKLETEILKPFSRLYEDMDTESDDTEDEEDRDPVLREQKKKADLLHERLCKRHQELYASLTAARTLDDAFNYMTKINRFEEKHFRLLPEYRVIGELMTRFKDATGKDKFLLAMKLNRALRLVERREEFNPNDSTKYGVINQEQDLFDDEQIGDRPMMKGSIDDDDEEEEFDDMKSRDDLLVEKVNDIDKMLEEKLAALDYTFGRKGKVLEEEIRKLAQDRNALTEKKNRPMYRKGFDVLTVDVNRTCKVTKGGQVVKYTAILVCGNYNGVVGYAKAKGPAIPTAIQKAREKCFQNLHYVDRYEDSTIAQAMQTTYKKTKLYLWPAKTTTGVTAGKNVQKILTLAGFKNVKSKIIGSRNPHNTVKAVFQALNAIETPKDIQEKFGRTVVESYLLE